MDLRANECAAYLGRTRRLSAHQPPPPGRGHARAPAPPSARPSAARARRAYCFANPEITENYRPFIAPYFAPEGFRPSCVVTVDVAGEGLFPEGTPAPVNLALDHHPSNSHFAENTCLAAEKSSCGELVLEVIKALCGSVSREEAHAALHRRQHGHRLLPVLEHQCRHAQGGGGAHRPRRGQLRAEHPLFPHPEPREHGPRGPYAQRHAASSAAARSPSSRSRCRCSPSAARMENDCEDLAGLAGKAEGVAREHDHPRDEAGGEQDLRSAPGRA